MSRTPVLLLAYVYPPDNYAGAARPHRFAKYLERLGHPVQVLAAGTANQVLIEGNVHRVRGEFELVRQNDFAALQERVLRKLLFPEDDGWAWAPRGARYARRLVSHDPKSVVISTSPPVAAHAVAYWLKKKYGLTWIADFRDPLLGPWKKSRRSNWLLPPMERAIFRTADAIIANTDASAEMWRAAYPSQSSKIHLIWNGFDPEDDVAARSLPPRSYRVLAHAGEIYGRRDPALLLESVDRLISSGTLEAGRLRIQLTGGVAESLLQSAAAKSLSARGCLSINPTRVSRAEAQHLLATSDYLLLLDMLYDHAALQVPAKLFEYVRMGRPILACTQQNSPVQRLLAMSGVPCVCLHPDDAAAETDRKVLQFLSMPTTPTPLSAEFNNTFDAARQAGTLSAIIEGLARPAPAVAAAVAGAL